MEQNLTISLTSPLEKVGSAFRKFKSFEEFSALRGEKFSFQAVIESRETMFCDAKLSVESDIPYKLYIVRDVPVELAAHANRSDDGYLSKKSGLYPDLLEPFGEKTRIKLLPKEPRVIWAELNIPNNAQKGVHEIKFYVESGENKAEKSFSLDVISASLPKQKLLYTQWFHYDCLSSYYGIEPMSERHMKIISNYMDNYAEFGGNMILTPIFTPALDTEIGGERPTVQLVDVKKTADGYSFSFDKLDKFMSLCESKGINYFEIAHLFTQWGAKFTPKIVDENGEKLSGWFLSADSEEYKNLIIPLIRELKEFLKKTGRLQNCYFHISDEPSDENLDSYKKAVELVKNELKDCKVMDALSEPKFYEQGLVKIPVAANDRVDEFINKDISPLWTYYCCAQGRGNVSNRFIAMPSVRNRIIAFALYKYNLEGFLHWSYDFYYSEESKRLLSPFLTTDGDCSFPAGDPFSVYPGADGKPMPSIRQFVFFDALQDMRAFSLLEELGMSRDETVHFIEKEVGEKISFKDFPKKSESFFDPYFILNVRAAVNMKIKKLIKKKDKSE